MYTQKELISKLSRTEFIKYKTKIKVLVKTSSSGPESPNGMGSWLPPNQDKSKSEFVKPRDNS